MNQIKGDKYEIYIKLLLENSNNKTWLWKDIPEFELKKSGLLGDWNEYRLVRKDNKINSIPDLGTDILLKTNEEYILVQCKNFESNNNVTIHHLSGFYAMISHFNMKGIVYYTSKLSSNIKLLKPNINIKFIREELVNSKIQQKISKLFPYYYQIEAYEKLKNSKRSILNLPCGMGKTLTSIMIAKEYDNIILVSPLIAYSIQNLERFNNELHNEQYNSLLINSDGIRDKDEILQLLNKNTKNILSFTYKSVDILIEILHNIKNKIIIIDEFHNLSKNDIFDNNTPFYKLLNSDTKILFMSATPKFFNLDDTEYNNKNIFGDNIYSFPMSRGISEKYICDYEIYLPDVRNKNNINDISSEISIKDLPLELTIKAKYILRGMLETGARKCITYLRNQEEAIDMVKILNKLNEYFYIELYTDYIISDVISNKREEILENFNNFSGFSIICSVSILDECIDIPQCDSIFISYPSESRIRNIQRLCRSNRIDKLNIHKKSKVFLWCEEYNEISIFISQLKEFDENFTENKICIMNIDNNYGGILERNKKEYSGLYKDLDDIIISIRKFGYGIDTWKKNLEELKDFIKKFNKLPSTKKFDETYLSHWIYDQNYHLKNNIDIMKLPEIQQLWKNFISEHKSLFIISNEIWLDRLDDLQKFIIKNNRLPSQSSSEDEYTNKLAKWIVRNNDQYDKNEKAMNDETIRLEWKNFKSKHNNLFNQKSSLWNDKLDLVISFIKDNNRLPIENKNKKEEYDLRIWLKTQEKIYNKNKFENDTNKKNNFEKVLSQYQSLFSKVNNFEIWLEKYNQMVEYIEKYNQLPKEKIKLTENNKEEYESLKSLGTWKSNQIQNVKINFVTVLEDIDISKLSSSEKEKHQKKLEKYLSESIKDNEILLKDYSKLNKKDVIQYDKIKLKIDKQKEERYESSEKLRLWNEIKEKYPKLFL
jgi:superfamily II DNA or RNA helicase